MLPLRLSRGLGFLLAAGLIALPAATQTLNAPRVGAIDPLLPKAAVVGTPVVTGTQTTAPVGACSQVTVRVVGQVSGTVNDGAGLDQIAIQLWDDGALRDSRALAIPVGATNAFDVTLTFSGQYGVGVPGVGIVIEDQPGGEQIYINDPFIPTDVPGSCGPGSVTAVPTLSQGGMATLILLCAALAWWRQRKGRG